MVPAAFINQQVSPRVIQMYDTAKYPLCTAIIAGTRPWEVGTGDPFGFTCTGPHRSDSAPSLPPAMSLINALCSWKLLQLPKVSPGKPGACSVYDVGTLFPLPHPLVSMSIFTHLSRLVYVPPSPGSLLSCPLLSPSSKDLWHRHLHLWRSCSW